MIRNNGRPAGNRAAKKSISGCFNSPTSVLAGTESRDRSPLRQQVDEAIAANGNSTKITMKDLTVLAPQNDPFRLDRPSAHRDGEWLAMTAQRLGLGQRKIHLRGLHYMIIGQTKPDGTPYANTEADWEWLSSEAGKAARWLGYLPFDQIVDQRNAAPTVQIFKEPAPYGYLTVGLDVSIPDADDIRPRVEVSDFDGVQPYKIVMVGEKSSLEPVLSPIAASYKADLYLPTGCLSDTLIYQMATIGAADGRPMVVLYFSDCDPSGWNMAVEVGRKLQAFKVLEFPDLDFEVHRVALSPDQVRGYGLPSTPLKATERRGDAWRHATGVEQTEIDALASLHPDLLEEIARDAIAPFFDPTLEQRVRAARDRWLEAAQATVDEAVDQDHLDRLRTEAEAKLTQWRQQLDAINDQLRLDVSEFRPTAHPDPRGRSQRRGASLAVTRFAVDVRCAVQGAARLEVLPARPVVMIDAACELALAGWRVFPCWPAGPRAKSPLTEHGHLDATTDPELIRQWWTRRPNAMIGAAVPDSLIVLDVDPRNGGNIDDLGPLPPTLRVWSGRGDGGVHLYFRRPDGPVVATRLPRGVDLKVNGYCIVPPSVHPTSGRPYQWESRPVAGLPPRLLALLRPIEGPERPKIKNGNGAGLIRTVAKSVEGKRDDTLFWAACRAVEDQIIDQIEDDLIAAAVGVGLSEHQARAKIGSARRTVGNG